MDLGAAGRLLPELTGDARADRWREHRVAVRAELVEATLRAIDEYGPDLSIDDVIKTAAIPRPKLYRFFADKDALFAAVGQRVQEMIVEQVVPQLDAASTALELVSSAVEAYVRLVDDRPNLFRFLVNSHFRDGCSPADLIEGGRPLSNATRDVWSATIQARGGEGSNFEYVVDAALGAVGLGVLRWLNFPTISRDALAEELTAFLWGAFQAVAGARGVRLNRDTKLELLAEAH
ncbi:TetR/AcrR family transcriptional regulator [Mycobacterium sp.]|uniref:TetR/AcrR family transcriptional regulator n=1 Tax=Mycobacterium sp. TaxID=1785 RepID=UPI0025F0A510|nr:TetR/AcrR family transcriptional regulator [Mycobacterium sp.]